MILGHAFRIGEQEYVCVGFQDYAIPRFGRSIQMIVLRTHCADCGGAFEFQASEKDIRQKWINRRCNACKAAP